MKLYMKAGGFTVGEMKIANDAAVLPAPEEWTTKRGLEVLSPASFGFDFEWRPFSEL
ncbi:MAG: DUF917 domain-containing protein [Synergistaceae bacterium]|jgi:DUF917 family protein|nr:DUF917 domain-containing protein [Synergistaceae bacterium]